MLNGSVGETAFEMVCNGLLLAGASGLPGNATAKCGMRDGVYVDSTPRLHVGESSFEDWFQAHPKATTGDKQLARDAYAAGMGDPLVTYATELTNIRNVLSDGGQGSLQ